MTRPDPRGQVAFNFLPGAGKTSGEQEEKIRGIVKEHLIETSYDPYHSARIEVKPDPAGSPRALVVTLSRKHTWTADRARIEVDPNLNVLSVDKDYQGE